MHQFYRQFQRDESLAGSMNLYSCDVHLDATNIINDLYPGYWVAVAAQGAGKVILPLSPVVVVYTAGSQAFGGSPTLRIGVPNSLTYAYSSGSLYLTSTDAHIVVQGFNGSDGSLADFANQPLVVSLANGSAAYGPIASLTLADGGADYLVDDNLTLSAGNGDATITVTAVDEETGAITAFTLTDAGTGYSQASGDQPSDTTTDSVDGSGAQFTVVSVLQGNGSLDISFDYKIISLF